jgi:antitoxin CcdA
MGTSINFLDRYFQKSYNAHNMRMEVFMGNAARKQSANLSIRGDLLQRAKQNRINLSKTLEDRLEQMLKERDREEWLKNNREAIKAANEYVDSKGLWSEDLRQF